MRSHTKIQYRLAINSTYYKSQVRNSRGFKVTAHGSKDYWSSVSLRYEVLRAPLNLQFTREELLAEDQQMHLVYKRGTYVLACAVLVPLSKGRIKMRQVAVDEGLQGQGLGKTLIMFTEAHAKDMGYTVMECNARLSAVPFYEKLGYKVISDLFYEVSIPHYKMEKVLDTKV